MAMKHKHKDIEGSRREFLVEIPPEEVKEGLDKVYHQMKDTVNMPGFRKGKIPRDIIEKHHGKALREQAITDLVSDSYRMVLRESNTMPVGMPHISDVNFKEGKDLSYKATVDIRPKIVLKNFKNIKVKKKPIAVNDEEVKKYISALQESYAQFNSIEDRPSKLGDYLICDVECERDGKPLYKEQKNIWFLLDRNHSVPELVDGLIGASKGDAKEIKANLKQADKDEGQALFKVKVNQIKEKHLPEVNDEFVKGLGTYQNLEELKQAAEKDILRRKENDLKQDMSNQIIDHILKNSQFSPPQGLVDEETEKLVEEAKENLKKKNESAENIEKKDTEIRKALKKEATKRVQLFFLLDEIATIEKVSVSEEEIDKMLEVLAKQSNTTKDKFKKYYEDNDLIPLLRNQLKESKVIEFLLNSADVKEER